MSVVQMQIICRSVARVNSSFLFFSLDIQIIVLFAASPVYSNPKQQDNDADDVSSDDVINGIYDVVGVTDGVYNSATDGVYNTPSDGVYNTTTDGVYSPL